MTARGCARGPFSVFDDQTITMRFVGPKCDPYLIKLLNVPQQDVTGQAAAEPRQVERYLASRCLPAETAARLLCGLLIRFLPPYYNSQFCVSFIFAIDQEDIRRL